jgi:hypothetical protein
MRCVVSWTGKFPSDKNNSCFLHRLNQKDDAEMSSGRKAPMSTSHRQTSFAHDIAPLKGHPKSDSFGRVVDGIPLVEITG